MTTKKNSSKQDARLDWFTALMNEKIQGWPKLEVIGVLIPFVLIASFYAHYHTYPRNDDAYYLETAKEIESTFRYSGIWEGIKSFYGVRGKPILHPAIGSLFMLLVGGNSLLGSVLCTLTFLFLFLYYVARIFREHLTPVSAVLATAVVGTVPWVFYHSLTFNSEIAFMSFALPGFYYLVFRDISTERRAAILGGIFIGLACCVRPVEAAAFFFFPVIYLIIRQYREKELVLSDILSIASFVVMILAGLVMQAMGDFRMPRDSMHYLLFLVPVAGVLAWRERFHSKTMVLFTGITSLIMIAWFGPFWRSLYDWALRATFGDFTKITGARTDMTRIGFVINVFRELGNVSLCLVIGVLVLNFIYYFRWRKAQHRSQHQQPAESKSIVLKQKDFSRKAGVIAVAILAPILLGALTYNGDLKYYLVSGVLTYCIALIWALRRSNVVVQLLLSAVLGLQVVFHFWVNWGPEKFTHDVGRFHEFMGRPLMREIYANNNAPRDIYNTIKKHLTPGKESLICFLQMRQFSDIDWVADSAAISVFAREEHQPWHFIRPFPFRAKDVASRLKLVKNECDLLVTLPMEFKPAPIEHFMSDVGEYLIGVYKDPKANQRKLASDGLEFLAVENYESGMKDPGKMLILRVDPKLHGKLE